MLQFSRVVSTVFVSGAFAVGMLAATPAMAQKQPVAGAGGGAGGTDGRLQTLEVCGSIPSGVEAHSCFCEPGQGGGRVWGSGPYTSDSDLCGVAQHAGLIGSKGGVVAFLIAPGRDSYTGSTANGITTSNWGSYSSSLIVVDPRDLAGSTSLLPACTTMPSGADEHECHCDGTTSGSVWGNSPYTSDSHICSAAQHSGVIDSSGGDVRVLRMGGLSGYSGSESFGIQTSDWGSYSSSIVFDWN